MWQKCDGIKFFFKKYPFMHSRDTKTEKKKHFGHIVDTLISLELEVRK